MERIPLYRRPAFILLALLAAAAVIYSYFLNRVPVLTTPRILLFTLPPLALICLIFLGLRSINIIFGTGAESRNTFTAWVGFMGIALLFLLNLIMFDTGAQATSLSSIVLDLDLLLITFLGTIAVSAQFVLPVEEFADRLAAIRRLIGHVLGERGPVTYVHDGQAIQAHGEDRRRGPGVFLVDQASAVVLRTDTAFTRAVGPGVVFTRPGERLSEAVDLRRQERTLEAEEPVFNPQDQKRSMTSIAVTRDGINISAQISVTFMVEPGHRREPREGRDPEKTPYEFFAPAVERAVFGHMYGQYEDIAWDDLPLLLMVDVWRDEIKLWSLSDLLRGHSETETPLTQIWEHIKARLIPIPDSKTAGEAGPGGEAIESDILHSRGIRVLDLEVGSLRVPQDVQRERLLQWRESWYGETQTALQEARDAVESNRRRGQNEANLLLLGKISSGLNLAFDRGELPKNGDTLALIVRDALSLCQAESTIPELKRLAPSFQKLLDDHEQLDSTCQELET